MFTSCVHNTVVSSGYMLHTTSFSRVTSTSVGIKLLPVPYYWTWANTTPQKNGFFWSNPYKTEVVITSRIKALELLNFGHMNASTIQIESRDKILLVRSLTEIITSWSLFQNNILRRPGVAVFADIIKVITMFIKKSLKTQEKLKELEIMYRNAIYICISWYKRICWFPVKKCW